MSILPGATLGIFGGGQLGRMFALAARPLGYRVHVLDPDPDCAARPIVEQVYTAPFTDTRAARALAEGCDVLTLEIEKVDVASIRAADAKTRVYPSAEVLYVIQDRGRQKAWLRDNGFPLGPYREVSDAAGLAEAVRGFGPGSFIKVCHGGYDGRGQARLSPSDDVPATFSALGSQRCVVEQPIALEREISVMVARRPSGDLMAFPAAHNHHENQILVWSVLPAELPKKLEQEARALACAIAERLGVVGLLCVEMFVTKDGHLLVNELAPRPHNSYHTSEAATVTSQFEQGIRAVCDLPLGSTEIVRPCAIQNLLGDLWADETSPNFAAALALPGVRIHLYGKTPRKNRKVGHILASAGTPGEAIETVQDAYRRLAARA